MGNFVSRKPHTLIKREVLYLTVNRILWPLTSGGWGVGTEQRLCPGMPQGRVLSFNSSRCCSVHRLYLRAPNCRPNSSDCPYATVKTIIYHRKLWTQATVGRKGAPENTGKLARKRAEERSRQIRCLSWKPAQAAPLLRQAEDRKAHCRHGGIEAHPRYLGVRFSPISRAQGLIWTINQQTTNGPSKLGVSVGA